jgi:TetR/AcrR family transcriptional regulator
MAGAAAKARKPASRNREESRARLLRTAGELMAEHGTIDVSLSEIAQRSGLNAALVRYYFGNKQGLLFALVSDVLGMALEQMRGLAGMDLDPVEKLKLHIKAIINIYFRYPYVNRLIHVMLEDPVYGQEVARTVSKPLADTQAELLEGAIASGRFKPIEPMLFYFIVLGACDQLFFGQHILRVAFGVDRIDDDLRRRYTATLLDIILHGLLIEPAASSD